MSYDELLFKMLNSVEYDATRGWLYVAVFCAAVVFVAAVGAIYTRYQDR